MLRLEWTVPATKQFERAQNRYHAFDPALATAIARRLLEATRTLGEQPERGRLGRIPGTREWRVAQTPYLLVYRVHGAALQLLHLRLQPHTELPPGVPTIERLEPGVAVLVSILLHLLMAIALMYASTPTVSPPQGTAGGSRMRVEVLGDTTAAEQTSVASPASASAATPVRSTLVKEAKHALPPEPARRPTRMMPARTQVQQRRASQTPTPTPTQRRPQTWTGRPPGMLDQDVAAHDEGMGDSDNLDTGYRNDRRPGELSMEVGGYQVIYDLRSETQLRAWKAQGMTEIAIILPGTQYRMACPLEIALRRGSGKCRLLSPDSPELRATGDAREVISVMGVYRHGETIWRGPGPYR